jgi:hypothetical protein
MAQTTYTYNITDTLNDKYIAHVLKGDIEAKKIQPGLITKAVVSVGSNQSNPLTQFDIVMSDSLTTAEKTELDDAVATHTGVDPEPKTPKYNSLGQLVVDTALHEGTGLIAFTPDWTKRETWWYTSTPETGITLLSTGDTKIFNIPGGISDTPLWQASTAYSVGDKVRLTAESKWWLECVIAGTSDSTEPQVPMMENLQFNDNNVTWKTIIPFTIVDVENPKISEHHKLIPTHAPKVYVDGVQQTPHSLVNMVYYNYIDRNNPNKGVYLDQDYWIDYDNHQVIFEVAPESNPTIDYMLVQDSVFEVAPTTGKMLRIKNVESQYSDDHRIVDIPIAEFLIYGNNVAKQVKYPGIKSMIDESNKSYPMIPKTQLPQGETVYSPFDLPENSRPIIWEYMTAGDLKSSLVMKFKTYLENNIPLDGTYATTTIYMTVENDI